MLDKFNRDINYLRVSLTSDCNLRCLYCMPKANCIAQKNNLTLAEFSRLLKLFSLIGITKIRFTGGEPLLYPHLATLINEANSLKSIKQIALTTNGLLLADKLALFKQNGLTSVNISLDCIDKNLFSKITRGGDINKVFASIKQAQKLNLPVKLNSVMLQHINEHEIIPLARFAKEQNIPLRFIELMPMGQARAYKGISEEKIKQQLEQFFGNLEPLPEDNSPAHYYRVDNTFTIGFISAVSHKFCTNCNRLRLTAAGILKSCLFSIGGTDLKALLTAHKSDEEILATLRSAIYHKPKQHHLETKQFTDKEHASMSLIGG